MEGHNHNRNERLPTVLLVWGAIAISGGIAWISPPFGLIAFGAFCIAGGILMIGGGDSDEQS